MSGNVHRGFQGILTACCISTSPVPFNCVSKEFESGDYNITYTITDGQGQRRKTNKSKNQESESKSEQTNDTPIDKTNEQSNTIYDSTSNQENEQKNEGNLEEKLTALDLLMDNQTKNENDQPENDKNITNETQSNDQHNTQNNDNTEKERSDFDYKFIVKDRVVNGDEDSGFKEDIMTICEHIRNAISMLYDCQVVNISLEFGSYKDNHEIWIINGDVTTTTNGFAANLFKQVENGEEEFTSFLIKELNEENESHQNSQKNKTSRSSSRSKGANDYDQKKKMKGFHQCYSHFPNCQNAIYRMPQIFAILYRAHQQFPTVNEARLYRMIKNRIQQIKPELVHKMVDVCIQCVHLYTAEERTYQGQKLTNRLPKDIPAPAFSALVPAELSRKGLRDVGTTPYMHKAYTYTINCRDSPYRDPVFKVAKPLDPCPRKPIQPLTKSNEKWVDRLCRPYSSHSVKVSSTSGKATERDGNIDDDTKLPPIEPTRQSYSEVLAPMTYTNSPFSYSFLDQKKKRSDSMMKRTKQLNRKWINEYQ